jgi:hypothetical protein
MAIPELLNLTLSMHGWTFRPSQGRLVFRCIADTPQSPGVAGHS